MRIVAIHERTVPMASPMLRAMGCRTDAVYCTQSSQGISQMAG